LTPTLAKIGLFEIAVAAVLGWALIARLEKPELLTRLGVKSPRRILQCHLDQIMMGLILIAVSLAVPDLPDAIKVPLIFGTLMNPLLFLAQAFSDTLEDKLAFKAVSLVSITATSGSLVAVAIYAV
jgi:hydroxylaminobenzene mutase